MRAGAILHRSAHATVAVEPPDHVVVSGPGLGVLTFARADIRTCEAMLVPIYRARHDAGFAADDEDIVIVLALEGTSPRILGPYPHAEGLVIRDALDLARRDVLCAVPGLSISVAEDGAALLVAMRGALGHMQSPIPTAMLHEISVAHDPPGATEYLLPSGIAPSSDTRYCVFTFWRGLPWALGPVPAALARAIAEAFETWRAAHPIDAAPTAVDAAALVADPSAWHGRRVEVVGRWQCGFEQSSFLGVWLRRPAMSPVTEGTYRVRVIGTWIYPDRDATGGYGHMGVSPGELRAEAIDVLETIELPRAELDGLTRLRKRPALALAHAGGASEPSCVALLDLDHFKRFNDARGHVAGDEVLRAWAAATVGVMRPGDVVVRWGGEKIAVWFPGTGLETAHALVERAVAATRALVVDGERAGVTISAGVVEIAGGEPLHTALERADLALYEAKRGGRDRAVAGPRRQ